MTKNIDNKTEIAIGLQAYESKIYDYPKIMLDISVRLYAYRIISVFSLCSMSYNKYIPMI